MWPAPRTKLNSGLVLLWNSAEILVSSLHLRTRIWVHAMIDLLKKSLSIYQSGRKEIRNSFLVFVECVGGMIGLVKKSSICQKGRKEIRNSFPVFLDSVGGHNKDFGTLFEAFGTAQRHVWGQLVLTNIFNKFDSFLLFLDGCRWCHVYF